MRWRNGGGRGAGEEDFEEGEGGVEGVLRCLGVLLG